MDKKDDLTKHKKELMKNPKFKEEYDLLNRCKRCGITPGKYTDKNTFERVGIYLLSDARGYMICNVCAKKGFLMQKEKVTKKEKKLRGQMRREMGKALKLPHITLNSKGEQV